MEGRWKNKLLYVKIRTRERMLRKCLTESLEGSAESTGIWNRAAQRLSPWRL